MPRWIILLGYSEVIHFVVSKANQKKITVVLSLDWFHVIYSPESCTASPPPDSETNVRQGGQHNFVSPLFSHAILFFPFSLFLSLFLLHSHTFVGFIYVGGCLMLALQRVIHIPSTRLSALSGDAHSSFSRYVCPPLRLSCQEAWSPLTLGPTL